VTVFPPLMAPMNCNSFRTTLAFSASFGPPSSTYLPAHLQLVSMSVQLCTVELSYANTPQEESISDICKNHNRHVEHKVLPSQCQCNSGVLFLHLALGVKAVFISQLTSVLLTCSNPAYCVRVYVNDSNARYRGVAWRSHPICTRRKCSSASFLSSRVVCLLVNTPCESGLCATKVTPNSLHCFSKPFCAGDRSRRLYLTYIAFDPVLQGGYTKPSQVE
jgi:hypothetical protein